MASRVEVQNLTCPGSTPLSAPVELTLDGVVQCVIRRITVVIPDGHAGLTGIAFGYGHQAVLPRGKDDYLSGNDEVVPLELSSYPFGPQWQAFMVNLDTIDHTWQVRVEVDDVPDPSPAAPAAAIDPLHVYDAAAVAA